MRKFNYESPEYLESLNKLQDSYWSKYRLFIKKYLKNKSGKFLDVGCGNGKNLKYLSALGYKNLYGAEVSSLFVEQTKSTELKNVYLYDGENLPFKNNFFDLIGSFNVLEHTSDPEEFLANQVAKLKQGGVLIVACPNFLSILFMSSHRRLKGLRRKLKNLVVILRKILYPDNTFQRMEPVIRKKFEYDDDDAIVVTNLLDLKKVLLNNNCEIIYESGFINYDTKLFKLINLITLIRYSLPSCFVIARKSK
jgi:SAM-dependent methyltransferase